MSVAPYVPTPIDIVKRMLEIAGADTSDVVFDLGCGDGRVLFAAIEEFKVRRAVGYELNRSLCESIMKRAENLNLQDRIQAINDDFFNADLSSATIVTLYLTTSGNEKLRPKLERELRSSARVVSHDFAISKWDPEGAQEGGFHYYKMHKIYLYKISSAYALKPQENHVSVPILRRIKDLFTSNRAKRATS